MSVYVIASYDVTDPDAYQGYVRGVVPLLREHGAEILAAEDVEHLAAAMEPGSVAGVLVYENRWAAPFASAARRSGGQLIASGRIPIQALIASLEADQSLTSEGA